MREEKADRYEQVGVAMTCRSFREYVDMFELAPESLQHPILDVAAGASSFIAEAHQRGLEAVAVDPLYSGQPESIHRHGTEEIASVTEKLSKLAHVYDWDYYGSVQQHEQIRLRSLGVFYDDYKLDIGHLRYVAGKLPDLPFADDTFSLVLCSHFLFLYDEQFDFQFHLDALRELVRVCKPGGEVLVYPLATFKREPYPRLSEIIRILTAEGRVVEQVPTTFCFLKGATHFLRIAK